MGGGFTLATTLKKKCMSDSLKIEDYSEQLKQLCAGCKRAEKCNHDKLCALKKFAFMYAKKRYKKCEKGCE